MSWQEQVFGPMAARTMENLQVRHLACAYDLSKDSRLAQAIVTHVNATLDAEERRRGVQRVRPGELLLRTRRGPLVLPLRTPEILARVIAGERLEAVRSDILECCRAAYLQLFSEASPDQAAGFLRCVFAGRSPRARAGQASPWWKPRRTRPWPESDEIDVSGADVAQADASTARALLDRGPPRPAHRPETYANLTAFLGRKAGIPPALQEPLLAELIAIRARCCPRLTTVASGQMPLVAMHPDAGRSLWQATRYQPMAPVVVSVLADGEARQLRYHPPQDYESFLSHLGRRIARALTQAYAQDGLLSYGELQWVFLASAETVSRAIDRYQRTHQVILPCPGSVLDMGRMLTHKSLIVRLHLQGHTVLEIARTTYHHPRSVDAYLKAFDAVLILHLYGLPPPLIATVLSRGETVIAEYLDLIGTYLKDADTMRAHLRSRGVRIPIEISDSG